MIFAAIVEHPVIEQVDDEWQMIHQVLRHSVGRLEDWAAASLTHLKTSERLVTSWKRSIS
jgi:hypothetical protein